MLSGTSAAFRVSAYYFLLFMSVGSGLPYVGMWLASEGMSGSQIGLILACPSFLMVLTTLVVGRLADRAKDWRSAIIACNWVIVVLVTLLVFAEGFTQLLLAWTLWGLVITAKFPIIDAAAVRMARQRNLEFHKMRAWGSLGFVFGTLLAGPFFELTGIESFVFLLLGLAVVRAVAAHGLPFFREGIESPPADSTESSGEKKVKPQRQLWYLLVLTGSALLHASHAYYYTFSAIIWSDAGYSKTVISMLWAIGVIVEIALMWKFKVFAKAFSARMLLVVAILCALVRWLSYGFEPSLSFLFVLQMLHGVTFALMFLATVNFIANWTPVSEAANAQALSATLNTFSMACATVLAGQLHSHLQFKSYWLMALLCCVAMVLVMLSWMPKVRSD